MTIQLPDLRQFRVQGYGLEELKFPNLEAAVQFVCEQAEDDDVVLANHPPVVNHYLADRVTHYFPQSRFILPVLPDNRRTVPLDRRTAR